MWRQHYATATTAEQMTQLEKKNNTTAVCASSHSHCMGLRYRKKNLPECLQTQDKTNFIYGLIETYAKI